MSGETKQPENPPAFPTTVHYVTDIGAQADTIPGMTLRDWFAGMALAAEMSLGPETSVAKDCYRVADAMLKERQKRLTSEAAGG